jgi:hypothetical protein
VSYRRCSVSRVLAINHRHSICTAILAGAVLLVACSGDAPGNEKLVEKCPNPELVCIRVENASDVKFSSFLVNLNGQEESYGPLTAGAVSEYRNATSAYRYAFTEAFSGERRFILQPIDFVGERQLPPGAYTYRYTADALDEPDVRDNWRLDGYLSVRLVMVHKTDE